MEMKNKIISFIFLFSAQFINFFLIVVNTRAYVNGQVLLTVLSDFTFASINYFVIKKIAEDDQSFLNWLAYSSGGTIGAVVGMTVSSKYLNI